MSIYKTSVFTCEGKHQIVVVVFNILLVKNSELNIEKNKSKLFIANYWFLQRC